jgi:hypothetical protein
MTRCPACGKPLTTSGKHCDPVCADAADVIVVANRVGVDWQMRIKTQRPRTYKVSKLRDEEAIA